MVTYGFYNSVDHDRTYDATQVSELFDGLIREGVYEFIGQRFAVSALSSGFQVSVGTGRAWFNHTWTKNDAELALTLPAPPTLPDRYRCDAIVLDINSDIKVRENKITYVSGEESASKNPPHPNLSTGTHYQVPLAWITRVGREENILQSNINYVVGTSVCPYVVGVLQEVDITAHVAQWEAAWNEWFNTKTDGWDEELAAAEASIAAVTSDVNTNANNAKTTINEYVAEFQVWIASQKSQLDGWMDNSKENFDTWFANLQYILDGDVAGHLQNEINDINSILNPLPINRGGTGNTSGYIRTGRKNNTQIGDKATCEGESNEASGSVSHAEGGYNVASGTGSHAEGNDTLSSGDYSHTEGTETKATGTYSHAEGYGSTASNEASHSEGSSTASGIYSHAEGQSTRASGAYSHAEGSGTRASRFYAHAEGYNTIASGTSSHAEGSESESRGNNSHAGGGGIALLEGQFVHGIFGFGGVPKRITATENGSYDGNLYGATVSDGIDSDIPAFNGGVYEYYNVESNPKTAYIDIRLMNPNGQRSKINLCSWLVLLTYDNYEGVGECLPYIVNSRMESQDSSTIYTLKSYKIVKDSYSSTSQSVILQATSNGFIRVTASIGVTGLRIQIIRLT